MRYLLTAPILLLAACYANDAGQLDQSNFKYECAASGNTCRVNPLTDPVARGASLSLLVQLRAAEGGNQPPTHLRSADEEVLRTEGPDVIGEKPGVTSILLLSPDDVVLDFYHVWVGEPSHIKAVVLNDDGEEVRELSFKTTMHQSESLRVRVKPFAQAQPMLGNFETTWQVEPAIITVTTGMLEGEWILTPTAPGTARITATALGLETIFDVEVLP